MAPVLYYCYDAYCPWCYGGIPMVKKLVAAYPTLPVEVLSGGMVISPKPKHISIVANYYQQTYKTVTNHTGVVFGEDFLWHIHHADESDWFPSSEIPAIALQIFKEIYPQHQITFATELQHALFYEGRDLADNEAYRHLLNKHHISADTFYNKMKEPLYKEKAHEDFESCKQLQVTGFPTLLLQTHPKKFFILASGYTSFERIKTTIDALL